MQYSKIIEKARELEKQHTQAIFAWAEAGVANKEERLAKEKVSEVKTQIHLLEKGLRSSLPKMPYGEAYDVIHDIILSNDGEKMPNGWKATILNNRYSTVYRQYIVLALIECKEADMACWMTVITPDYLEIGQTFHD